MYNVKSPKGAVAWNGLGVGGVHVYIEKEGLGIEKPWKNR